MAQLQQDDPAQYRQLQERDVNQWVTQLRGGDSSAEPAFLAAFTKLADHLLLDDPAAFATLVEEVRDLPLDMPAARQQRRFYEGLVLGQGDHYAEALTVFDALLAEPGLDEQVRGRTLNTRANYCRYTGRLEEALTGYAESLRLWQRLGNRLRAGLALLNLGITRYDLHEYTDAEASLTQAVRCFEDAAAHSWLAAAYNELGLVCRDQGLWADALTHLRSAESYYLSQGAFDPLSHVRNNIGEVLLFQGQIAEAAGAFQQALASMQTRTYAVDAHLNLGLARQTSGDLPGALAAFHDALDLAQAIDRQDILAHVHYRLGDALRRSGRDDEALAQFTEAVEVIEKTRQPLHREELKISLMGRWQQVYETLVLHCLSLGRPEDAFAWAERARARAFADAVAVAAQPGDGDGASVSTAIATAPEVQVALTSGEQVLCYFTTGVLEQDQPLLGKLPAGAAVREHLVTPARTLLFILTRDRLSARDCALDPNTFTSASPRKEDPSRYLAPPVLRRLYDWLLAPAASASAIQETGGVFPADVRRLYIIPHGPIHRVSFGALTDPNSRPVIRLGGPVLAYSPSATVLLRLLQRRARIPSRGLPASIPNDSATPREAEGRGEASPASSPALLAVGYDGSDGANLLRHTEAEARFVAQVAGGQAWVGARPKRDDLALASRGCQRLHFACHAQFDYDAPLESYLATGQGERLTARAVLSDWQLPSTLVVLSACQTGVSRVLRGDEPVGLVRAFLYAGARAVLVSQWAVEDLSTFLLMQRFYELLASMGDPASALQAAQVWLRELTSAQLREHLEALRTAGMPVSDPATASSSPPSHTPADPFANPRFWAAFTIVGAA
jgi:CHAT domain-containing protein/tetratricopeptide (TPR) repeat protein